jgi:glycosyltransferase involved in cell wall biosynthesis
VVAAQVTRWLPDTDVAILPNGIDTEFWRGARRTGAPAWNDGVVFVSAMRLSRKKRPARLLRAFASAARLTSGAPAMKLVVAGDGPDRVGLVRYAAALGIADRVSFPGQLTRDELRHLYGRADAFVLPSERESFGIAALEARAAGLPVVAMLESGVRDFITQGVEGLLARDERDLAGSIARLALDGSFRAYVARHNADRPPPHDWTDVAAVHERIYTVAAELRGDNRPSQR